MENMSNREAVLRKRCRQSFEYYALKNLRILAKPMEGDEITMRRLVPFKLNFAQKYIHDQIEKQRKETGMVRAIILKGRQQGASTYVEGRDYWITSQHKGIKTFILTHAAQATDNLFKMVERFFINSNPLLKPHVGKMNQKEFTFDKLDSEYQVATAGAKGAGRSATITHFHGSEVAFWDNAGDHLSGALQAVPRAPGTEVILESTANGIDNVFHSNVQQALKGEGDFILIFVPWFWQVEYAVKPPADFELHDNPGDVPDGELTEIDYAKAYKLRDDRMYWRRLKIIELGQDHADGYRKFQQEYPANPAEAFQASTGESFITPNIVMAARKMTCEPVGPLIIGVDPARKGNDPFGIIRRRGRRAYDPQLIHKIDIKQAADLLWRIIQNEKPSRMNIDIGGLGVGVYDNLVYMKGTAGIIVPVNFGENALENDRFYNRIGEMYWLMREWLKLTGGVDIPDDDNLHAELVNRMSDEDNMQRFMIESKKKMKARGVASPNLAEALALTFAEPIGDNVGEVRSAGVAFDPLTDEHYTRTYENRNDRQGTISVEFDPYD